MGVFCIGSGVCELEQGAYFPSWVFWGKPGTWKEEVAVRWWLHDARTRRRKSQLGFREAKDFPSPFSFLSINRYPWGRGGRNAGPAEKRCLFSQIWERLGWQRDLWIETHKSQWRFSSELTCPLMSQFLGILTHVHTRLLLEVYLVLFFFAGGF